MNRKRILILLLAAFLAAASPTAQAAPAARAAPRASQAPRAVQASPAGMVLVPAGWFLMGSNEGNDNEFPRRRVYLDAYHIDKYPVTNQSYRGARAQEYIAPFNLPAHPAVGVTWFQAERHCRSSGKRLPTEAEWEKAARGVEGQKYPWGDRWDSSKLVWAKNSGDRTHPVNRSALNHTGPFGAADMVGNVMEWVADWYRKDFSEKAPDRNPKGPAKGAARVLRGGSWYTDDPWDLGASGRQRIVPGFWDDDIGFRCAKGAN